MWGIKGERRKRRERREERKWEKGGEMGDGCNRSVLRDTRAIDTLNKRVFHEHNKRKGGRKRRRDR